ncbi:putative transcription factor bHLH041 isoform X2 [Ananas comosus]|uniref:Transcription factor bHLH041 isoform X2 n=1 Tax=Ananas comosus TaxID=4615 RepID=A0A6P5G9Y2_ANACO|nr:putative transcription factor bHLH041 isoform X2 [Ananas comosus]
METGWYYSSEGSDMDFSQTLSDGYWGSFCSIDNGLTLHCNENGGANSMNLGADQEQMQLYQMNMQTDNKQLAEEEEAATATAAAADEDLVYEKRKPSSSSSSKKSSFYFPTPSFDLDPSKAKLITPTPHSSITAMRSHNQNLNPKFPTLERDGDADDVAIMRAMVVVISSTSSSSSPSSPSVLSNPPSQDYFPTTQSQRRGNGKIGAFKRYSRSDLTAKSEAEDNCNYGQSMMKRSILMLRRLSSFEGRSRESKSTSNQLHHVISERRRREKLNASFEALRMQLPPGTKKDKTSVLINTKNYVNTLRSQISELKEKNRRLETCLMITDEGKEASHGLNGRAQVRLIKCSSPTTSELQQINLTITLRVECDIIELVLHILECLKVIRSINLISVDAYTYSPQMNLFAKASIKFGIKDCDWDEALFHEAMTRAVDDVILNTATPIISELSRLF